MTEHEIQIPSSFFFEFFEKATILLNAYPNPGTDLMSRDSPNFPIGLDKHRGLLLGDQRYALNEVLSHYSEVSIENAQSRLRELGHKNLSHVRLSSSNNSSDSPNKKEEEEKLLEAMNEMNNAARAAFVRGVMKAEIKWVTLQESKGLKTVDEIYASRNLRTSQDGKGALERSKILEFCGLCMAAVRLDGIIRHFCDGSDIFGEALDSHSTHGKSSPTIVQMRVVSLQNMMLCAVGCHPMFGSSELKRLMLQHEDRHGASTLADSNLRATLASFFTAMQVAFTNAMLMSNKPNTTTNKSSNNDSAEGATRVVSVQYSEKVIHAASGYDMDAKNNAPSCETMDEHEDERQKKELQMAKQAASLKQGILAELLSMDTDQREIELQHAGKTHDDFLTKAMQLPPGPDRVAFVQNVDEHTQKLLVMHKLWNSLLAKNGGTPPTIVAQNS
jgi:hypothetical protein